MAEADENSAQQEGMSKEGWNRAFQQMWDQWFLPEIKRRREAGEIDENFHLYIAQMLQPPEGGAQIIFNEEVKGTAVVRTSRAVEKGEPVNLGDLADLQEFELPDEKLDCAHFTIIRSGQGWNMTFNFLSGRSKARDMLELAGEYLQSSIDSAARNHAGPSVDNLYHAAELVSKAELILHRNKAAQSKTHGPIASGINAWARLGNIDAAFVALFNKLGQQRPNARYGDQAHRPSMPDADSFDLVRAMIDRGLEKALPTRAEVGAD